MFCSHCGTENLPDAYSCDRCGERVVAPDPAHPPAGGLIACPDCSASNEAHALYCVKCGHSTETAVRLSPEAAEPRRAQRPAAPRSPEYRPIERPREQRAPAHARPGAPGEIAAERSAPVEGRSDAVNDSGSKTAVLPPEARGWNWGAFLVPVIWGIGNQVWIALLQIGFIILMLNNGAPGAIAYLGFSLLLGFKGNEWAWRAKRWDGVDHFRRVQQAWVMWAILLTLLGTVLLLVFGGGPAAA